MRTLFGEVINDREFYTEELNEEIFELIREYNRWLTKVRLLGIENVMEFSLRFLPDDRDITLLSYDRETKRLKPQKSKACFCAQFGQKYYDQVIDRVLVPNFVSILFVDCFGATVNELLLGERVCQVNSYGRACIKKIEVSRRNPYIKSAQIADPNAFINIEDAVKFYPDSVVRDRIGMTAEEFRGSVTA